MDNSFYSLDHVKAVLAMHPWECVFELDAPRKIAQRLQHRTINEWLGFDDWKKTPAEISARTAELKYCYSQSEIYCPHEGIDRTKELGITVG